MLSSQLFLKRTFDIFLAMLCIILAGWIILLAWIVASIDTRQNGFFTQIRVGMKGKLFKIIKIQTMKNAPNIKTSVTTIDDSRITTVGRFFRKTKIDELPQLISVLTGDMSFVGPRPDVSGFANKLSEKDKMILLVRPGITGPATLKYRDEENILAAQEDPEKYNREVLFPDKVRINREYVENLSFWGDIQYILRTVFGE